MRINAEIMQNKDFKTNTPVSERIYRRLRAVDLQEAIGKEFLWLFRTESLEETNDKDFVAFGAIGCLAHTNNSAPSPGKPLITTTRRAGGNFPRYRIW